MENILSINVFGKTRKATLNGRSYLVAPSVILVSGVLNGSKGALYYPPDEVEKEPHRWNHIPIVVNHPMLNGVPVSGRDPQILDKYWIGHVYKTTPVEKNGKVKLWVENWFDEESTKRVDARIWALLERGEPIELSTGLLTDNQVAVTNSSYNGIPFQYIARNYRPDHLAILPDNIGACSIKDGCGVLINQAAKKWFKEHSIKKTEIEVTKLPEISNNTGDTNMDKTALVSYITTNCDCWKEPADRETLNSFSEAKLLKMKEVIDKAKQDAQFVANASAAPTNPTPSSPPTPAPASPSPSPSPSPSGPTTPSSPAPSSPSTPSGPKSMTVNEWLATAPNEIQSAVRNAMSIEQRERDGLIQQYNQLTANSQNVEVKNRMLERLKNKPLDELRDIVESAASAVQIIDNQAYPHQQGLNIGNNPVYFGDIIPSSAVINRGGNGGNGNGNGGNGQQVNNNSGDDLLIPPTINWEEEYKTQRRNVG